MSDVLISRKQDAEAFWNHWHDLAERLAVGPRATRLFAQWAFAVTEERGLEDDLSFALVHDGRPVAAALMPVGHIEDAPAITFGGGYVTAPLIADRAFRKEVFRIIDERAAGVGAKRALLTLDPLSNDGYNSLQSYGYLDTSILAHVIDLTRPGNLLNQCRHGHVYDIKRMMKDPRFTVVTVDAAHPDRAHHEGYERLHEKCSGRKTRSTHTFDQQYEQLLAGEAVLFGLLRDGVAVAYAYFQFAHGKGVYASAADDPDVSDQPLYHRLVYAAMEYGREHGISVIDTGEPASPSPQLTYWPDAKQRNIALFKRGFVGDYRPLYRGIRYYDPNAALADTTKFAHAYTESLKKI